VGVVLYNSINNCVKLSRRP